MKIDNINVDYFQTENQKNTDRGIVSVKQGSSFPPPPLLLVTFWEPLALTTLSLTGETMVVFTGAIQ